MPDVHKMAMVASLLRRRVPKEVAGLAADAVHPFAELGDWPPDRRARKEAKAVARRVAGNIGQYRDEVPVEELKAWTRWAFSEYARIAGSGSHAARVFADSANRHELMERQRSEDIARGIQNARGATTGQLLQALRLPEDQAKWPPLLHPKYRHLLIPSEEDEDADGTRVVVCNAMVTTVDKRVEDVAMLRVSAEQFHSWPLSTTQEIWSEEEDRKHQPSATWDEALRESDARLAALRRNPPLPANEAHEDALDRAESELRQVEIDIGALAVQNPDSEGYDCPFCKRRVTWQSLVVAGRRLEEPTTPFGAVVASFEHARDCEPMRENEEWRTLRSRHQTLTILLD